MELLRGMRNLEDDAAGAWRLERKRSKKLDRIKRSHCRIYSAGKHRARIVRVLKGGRFSLPRQIAKGPFFPVYIHGSRILAGLIVSLSLSFSSLPVSQLPRCCSTAEGSLELCCLAIFRIQHLLSKKNAVNPRASKNRG